MHGPRIELEGLLLRPWTLDDQDALVKHANNPKVAMMLRDAFPQPYTPTDARAWLKHVSEEEPSLVLAMEIEGEAAGSIGVFPQKDVYRYNGELGYWLSESYWGQGYTTRAIRALCSHVFTHTHLLRLFASVFSCNPASMCVLEKCGFKREAVLRKSVMKQGQRLDEHYYAFLKEEWESALSAP